MTRAAVFLALLASFAGFAIATDTPTESPEFAVVILKKQQLGALTAAIRKMERVGRSYKAQQVRIEDHGESFHISFMDDPIDMAIAGDQNGASWEVRKKDFKVVREILVR